MTYDLFKSDFPSIMDRLDNIGNVATLTLNPYLPGTPTLREKTDEFLCHLEDIWRWRIRFSLREYILKTIHEPIQSLFSCHSCSGVCTIEPDGNIKNGCAHEGFEHYEFEDCKGCKYRRICLPNKCPK